MCAGDTAKVSFGFDENHNVVVERDESSQSYSVQIFLPDGTYCGTMGCSYRSPVTFTGFADTAIVTSAEDIKYVRLNMEHSYLGDLYINITCPNGQKADILKFSNYNSNSSLLSTCLNNIPSNSRGWATPSYDNNMRAYLGISSFTDNATDICNPALNPAGTGWDYCWSNNTTSGFSYAGNGGYVYRSANQTFVENRTGEYSTTEYYRVNASNLDDSSNFYHPDQSFENLVGCPLNGEWYIEVIDGVKQDNGYIFEWELSLDEALLTNSYCAVTGYTLTGEGVERVDDSSFTLVAPQTLLHDTVLEYTYTIHTACGDIDTVALLTIHPSFYLSDTAEGCDKVSWKSQTFTSDTVVTKELVSQSGCDSVIRTQVIIHQSYHSQEHITIVENELPYNIYGHTFDCAVTDSLLADSTVYGCDSIMLFTLDVIPNVHIDTTIVLCPEQTPFYWNGLVLNTTTDTTVILPSAAGADSAITLHLTVLPLHETHFTDSLCSGRSYTFGDSVYNHSGIYSYSLPGTDGCDSILTLHLTILGSDIRAQINAVPYIVTRTEPEFKLHDASINASSREWTLPDGTYSQRDLVRTFPDNGSDTFPVMLVAYGAEGCTDTARTNILLDRTAFFIPNAFTPGQSTNNRWQPVGSQVGELEIWIYSREGLLVTHLEGVDASWDGNSADGTPCRQGSYVYHLRYRTTIRPQQEKSETGTILLIR